MSDAHLRPDPDILGQEWRSIVEADYEQAERVREWHDKDHYRSMVQHFVEDPHRPGDDLLNQLRSFCTPETTWLDVGAGGGRYALPLALLSKQVIAVEPSEAMRAALTSVAHDNGIGNVDVRPVRWPDEAGDIQADYSLIAHVGYDIREINPFLDALEAATRERCFSIMMDRAPSSGFERLWPAIHGETRTMLPASREMIHLLLARGVLPDVRIYPRDVTPLTEDEVRQFARRRLWLSEGSEKDRKLQALLDKELEQGISDFGVPTSVALIAWRPRKR